MPASPVDVTDSGILLAFFDWAINEGYAFVAPRPRRCPRITVDDLYVQQVDYMFRRKKYYGKHSLQRIAKGFGIKVTRNKRGLHFDHELLGGKRDVKLAYVNQKERSAENALTDMWQSAKGGSLLGSVSPWADLGIPEAVPPEGGTRVLP